jgi:hypothetical protein
MATPRRSYVAVTVTLATANTNYNLLTLVNAILAAETQGDNTVRVSGAQREFNIQANPGIDSVGANNKDVILGDSLLSATRVGYVLVPGASRLYRSNVQNADFGSIYAQSAGTNQKLNIELETA